MVTLKKKKTPNEKLDQELEKIIKHCKNAQSFMQDFLENPNKYTKNLELALQDTIIISEDIRNRLKKPAEKSETFIKATTSSSINSEKGKDR
jgi:flagellar biosynthesis chaperone FliJ